MAQLPIIVGIGETLWDCFPDRQCLGGAPLNFACSAAELAQSSAQVSLVSAVGTDELGREALAKCASYGVDVRHVTNLQRPTGQVFIEVDANGVPSYRFKDHASWDHLPWTSDLENLAKQCDAVCFGSLGQRSEVSRQSIQLFVSSAPKTTLRVFDINLRSPFIDFQVIDQSLLLANVLKLNDEELRILAQRYDLTGSEATLLSAVSARFQLHTIALTRGVNGSMLWSHETVSESSGTSVKVVDTVGAGDAFTAALVLGLLSKETLHMINNHTSQVAAYACSQPGATMAFPTDLRVSASR